ncbi:hypothetical protein GLAREA_04545 [Glarea lozoyensis ATCC 20868]|uniref:Uncharacterized protein n=2 Tax=Glarea lozoyensis TaxID=101852 RepID=S3CRQ2_GLAL2|nr:uncharacterized protein GLAREA_04545 [Glarea lozoyensis ATCC 20868]EHL00393.1 hypothetical protein M7I_3676 [Glarea lozoyensis 74030]EPE27754.1 hypothetical protein GLAREA_04545 [Glarea lozoyensis ATCC 20868]
MAVIWGLDLKEIQWGKFKSANMFDKQYHLRTTKMIVYQIAMILMVISESVGTAALSDYVDQQDGISTRNGGIVVQNNNIIGTFSFNIFVGIAVATIFGSGFFFDLFWPERVESPGVRLAWKISAVVVSFMALADQIASTVIVARYRAHIRGLTDAQAEPFFRQNGPPNPIYRHNAECVASVVVGWPGVIASFASAYIMWKSINHDEKFGPKSSKYVTNGGEAGMVENGTAMTGDVGERVVAPDVTA